MNNSEARDYKGDRKPHRDQNMENFLAGLVMLKRNIKKQSTKARFWLEIIGLLGLFFYASFAALQWCAMRDQGNVMSGQLAEAKREQRPWIGVMDDRIVQFGSEKDYTVEVEIADSGKDPALKAWYWDKSNLDPKAGPAANKMDDGKKHVYIGSIPPQGHRKITLNWKWDEWKSGYGFVANHVSSISNYGEIVYHDSDGEERRTQFCIYMKDAGLPSQRLTFCDQWNEMN
jgi:hypothetical protein